MNRKESGQELKLHSGFNRRKDYRFIDWYLISLRAHLTCSENCKMDAKAHSGSVATLARKKIADYLRALYNSLIKFSVPQVNAHYLLLFYLTLSQTLKSVSR